MRSDPQRLPGLDSLYRPAGGAGWRWVPALVPALVPAPGEAVIGKHLNSSFEQTTLSDEPARIEAAGIIDELDSAMTWISYPGTGSARRRRLKASSKGV
jgi:hypothetical protein